jgi:ubiquinone/menaquinone biosynthesis C-methylase UbiE
VASDDGVPSLDDGFTRVDAQPDPSRLVEGMDQTAEWPAVRRLRSWERDRLAIGPGDGLLDVGCGLGEVAASLAVDAQPGGTVVGVDASEAMLAVARARARANAADIPITFRVGDASAIDETDATFDACRSERMLQWVPDIEVAIAEMVRVLRPGGRLCLIDTDWRTLLADIPDTESLHAVSAAMYAHRGPSAGAGTRLFNTCRDAGLVGLEYAAATHVWDAWDPDADDQLPGLFPLRPVIGQLAEHGLIDHDLARRFVDGLEVEARRDRLFMSLTMFAVFGRTSG